MEGITCWLNPIYKSHDKTKEQKFIFLATESFSKYQLGIIRDLSF